MSHSDGCRVKAVLACGNAARNCTLFFVAAALIVSGVQARADLIATDHFLGGEPGDPSQGEYDLTRFLNQLRRGEANGGGQNPDIPGFAGPWSGNVTSGSLGVAQWTVHEDGISTAVLPYAQGGRIRFNGVDNLQRRVQRELAPYTASDIYYISLVSQVLTDETDLDGFVGIGFTNTGATVTETDANIVGGSGLKGLLIGAAGNGTGTDYVVRHVGSTGEVQNDVILSNIVQNTDQGTPFARHTIAKLEFNDDPDNPAGNSKITIWQDPSDFSSEVAASASVTPLEFRTFALDTNADLTHMTFTGVDYSRPTSFDEPRLATSWEAIAGGVADFDSDGDVDGSDFLVWQRNFGLESGATLEQGDGNGDGAVDGTDLAFWSRYFGVSAVGEPPAVVAAVPEPTALVLFAFGGCGLLFALEQRSRRLTAWRYQCAVVRE